MIRRHRKNPPLLWLMTDERIATDRLLQAVAQLPRGQAGIVFRHYATPKQERRALFDRIAAIARRRRLVLILAGPTRQAIAWGADGWHGHGFAWTVRPLWHSTAVHDRREMQAAHQAGADLLFLSPLFATRSHPGARPLGRVRFATLAREAPAPVMALGGVRLSHKNMVKGLGALGWAAIDGLTTDRHLRI